MRPIATDRSTGMVGASMRPVATDRSSGVVGPSMRPIATDRSTGMVGASMRPIATDAQQWRGRCIHAAYCYRRAAVAWSVHPCGLLLQTRSSGVVGPGSALLC